MARQAPSRRAIDVTTPNWRLGMRKLFGGMVLVVLVLPLPAAAQAQRRAAAPMGGAKHEFGVDVGLAYVSSNITGVDGGIVMVTPLDVRFGFVPRSGKMMWEPRVTLNFSTVGWRKPYESAAWRYEVGLQWVSSSTPLGLAADYIAIGGRVGISLWH